jgi:hypothetical protein
VRGREGSGEKERKERKGEVIRRGRRGEKER